MSPSIPFGFLTGAPGPGEWILLFLVILVFFGPRRLPEIARMLGRMLEELRRASSEFRDQVMQIDESPPIDVPSEEGPPRPDPRSSASTDRGDPLAEGESEEVESCEGAEITDAADADPSTER